MSSKNITVITKKIFSSQLLHFRHIIKNGEVELKNELDIKTVLLFFFFFKVKEENAFEDFNGGGRRTF
jgi:hypothetical protein